MTSDLPPSFSKARQWSLGLNVLVSSVAVLALLLMVNYLAARHYARWSWSAGAQAELSPLSLRVLTAVTNPVKITLYFDKEDPLFEMSYNLLKTYSKRINYWITSFWKLFPHFTIYIPLFQLEVFMETRLLALVV